MEDLGDWEDEGLGPSALAADSHDLNPDKRKLMEGWL